MPSMVNFTAKMLHTAPPEIHVPAKISQQQSSAPLPYQSDAIRGTIQRLAAHASPGQGDLIPHHPIRSQGKLPGQSNAESTANGEHADMDLSSQKHIFLDAELQKHKAYQLAHSRISNPTNQDEKQFDVWHKLGDGKGGSSDSDRSAVAQTPPLSSKKLMRRLKDEKVKLLANGRWMKKKEAPAPKKDNIIIVDPAGADQSMDPTDLLFPSLVVD
eukprot:CAMPEP_0197853412 /NCGR_PEP_ID=MMETSP1438-20131217/22682_1 /TAXON_ID=1461541 /ORGANISM="Pterosperma sp., Strain CCMP1384" /LENGTH=214 /DNA_ID=CAMNT_0043467817 /DNA_START=330 /DNA_END=974 /DNA_ORIENTATION=-